MADSPTVDLKAALLHAAKKQDTATVEKLLAGQPEALKKSVARAVQQNDIKRLKSLLK
jgi:hypothetical protein